MPPYALHLSDNLAALRAMPDSSVDSIVTDPPYGLSFMGKKWDYDVPSVEVWQECLRVLKPGGHLLAFAGTRTQHRMAVRIEDAGFEIRDMIAWVYGSGFPKSLDVSKAIDKAAGAEREVIGRYRAAVQTGVTGGLNGSKADSDGVTWATITAPATEAARQWQGWGTALKPALEPITVARKPLIGTVVENVLEHGTGAINVDGCRVPGVLEGDPNRFKKTDGGEFVAKFDNAPVVRSEGRWPANLIHDGSDEVTELFPVTGPSKSGGVSTRGNGSTWSPSKGMNTPGREVQRTGHNDNGGSAARFFYCAKASKKDRDDGCEGLEAKRTAKLAGADNDRTDLDPVSEQFRASPSRNHHPTVKPTDLMRYLCRLVTPPGGVVLDPFMGSGSTGKAAMLEGFRFIGCELSEEYFKIAEARISAALASQPLL